MNTTKPYLNVTITGLHGCGKEQIARAVKKMLPSGVYTRGQVTIEPQVALVLADGSVEGDLDNAEFIIRVVHGEPTR